MSGGGKDKTTTQTTVVTITTTKSIKLNLSLNGINSRVWVWERQGNIKRPTKELTFTHTLKLKQFIERKKLKQKYESALCLRNTGKFLTILEIYSLKEGVFLNLTPLLSKIKAIQDAI